MRLQAPSGALLLLLLAAAAAVGLAQLHTCPVLLTRKVPLKTVTAGSGITTTLKVTNPGSRPVVVNVGISLPDNVCATKNGVAPALSKRSGWAKSGGAFVANQHVFWADVPIAPAKSRSFKVSARVSASYPTTTTSISTFAYMLDEQSNLTCLSTLADAQLAIRARTNAPRPGTVLNCTRTPAPPTPGVDYYEIGEGLRVRYAAEAPLAASVASFTATDATNVDDVCWKECGSDYGLTAPYYFTTTTTGRCFCSQRSDFIYDPKATSYKALRTGTRAPTMAPTQSPTSTPPKETFYKPSNANWTEPEYYDVITDDVWLTRQTKGPIYNLKYYYDTYGRDSDFLELNDDFWYGAADAVGGTHGVKWAFLNDRWATEAQKPYLNYTIFGKIGDPTNFMNFHAITGMVRVVKDGIGVPQYFVPTSDGGYWVLNDGSTYTGVSPPYLVGVDLGIYIESANLYCKWWFTHWGENKPGAGEVGWERSCFYNL